MFDWAICEIAGKQIKVLSNKPFDVTLQNDADLAVKTLLIAESGKIKLGKPYLKENLKFKVVGQKKGEKIRVFKYHAKANYRKMRGYRDKLTTLLLAA